MREERTTTRPSSRVHPCARLLQGLAAQHVAHDHTLRDLRHHAFLSIDSPETVFSEDSIAITPVLGTEWHILHVAVSDIGTHSELLLNANTGPYAVIPHGHRIDYSLHTGPRPALIVSFATDGEQLEDAHVYRGIIDPVRVPYTHLPGNTRDTLLHLTRRNEIQASIEDCMYAHRGTIGQWLARTGIPAAFHNVQPHGRHKNGQPAWRRQYSTWPGTGNQREGIPYFTDTTVPILDTPSRVTDMQAGRYLAGRPVYDERALNTFNARLNRNRRALRHE